MARRPVQIVIAALFLIIALLVYAGIDAGREPQRTIAQPVAVPGSAQ